MERMENIKRAENKMGIYQAFIWFFLYALMIYTNIFVDHEFTFALFLPILFIVSVLTLSMFLGMSRRIKAEAHSIKQDIAQLSGIGRLLNFCWSLKNFRMLLLSVAALVLLETLFLNTLASIIINPGGDDEVLAIIPMLVLFLFAVIVNPLVLFWGGSIATEEMKLSLRTKFAMLLCALFLTFLFLLAFDTFLPSHGVFVTIDFIYGMTSLYFAK